jgi:SpoVK/Ycf46/Vps4 family AAA+-type ATPase
MAGKTKKAAAYRDQIELLDAHLQRLECKLRAYILRVRQDESALGSPYFTTGEDGESPLGLLERAADLEIQIAARLNATGDKIQLPIRDLETRFGLDSFERDVVLLALAPSLDRRFERLFALAKNAPLEGGLDVDLVLSVLSVGEQWARRMENRSYFQEQSPLLREHIITLDRHRLEMGASFLSLGIRLPARVLSWVLGDDDLDASLCGFSQLIEPDISFDKVVLPQAIEESLLAIVGNHREYMESMAQWELDKTITYGRGLVLLFVGAPGTGKTMCAKAIAHALKMRIMLVDPQQIYDLKRPVEDNLTNLFREARLQNAVIFFDECEGILGHRAAGNPHISLVLSAIEHYDGIVVLSTNLAQLLDESVDRRVLYRVHFEAPSVTLRRRIWAVHLPEGVPLAEDVDIDQLARVFEFTGGYIKNAVLVAINRALNRPERPTVITHEDLEVAARTQMRTRLSEYAERHTTTLRLDDLILSDDTAAQITEVLDAARSRSVVFREWGFGEKLTRGTGLSALFDGESGTGKTLCAEILAAELGLTLYRIQVANVVSKYIGETEKNLTRIFKEADDSHCLLLFDEADSLFTKRTEVKSVQDKYANMEVNVLLQLMERYDGLVLLTTNLKKGIDQAFERRLSFKINFPFPEAVYRERIWQHLIPDQAPLEDGIDFYVLARSFELSGGSIKNAILRGAYRAAAAARPISMDDLVESAKRECASAGKLYRVIERDF